MQATLEPILQDCRDIYELGGVMERFSKYIRLMTETRGELLPLCAFSPMGKRQAGEKHLNRPPSRPSSSNHWIKCMTFVSSEYWSSSYEVRVA